MEKRTAFQIATDAIDEQRPINSSWLRSVYNSCKNEKERRQWAKHCLEVTLNGSESKQLIGKAVTEFLYLIKQEF